MNECPRIDCAQGGDCRLMLIGTEGAPAVPSLATEAGDAG